MMRRPAVPEPAAPVEPHDRLRPIVLVALSAQVLISAGTYLAAKRAMAELHPFTLVLWRFLLSSGVFAGILVVRRAALPPRSELGRILFLGLMAGPVNQGLFFYGLSLSTPAHAALIYALTPLGVYLAGLARGRERATRRALVGIAIAFLGVVVLLLGRGLAAAEHALVGDLFILGAVVAWVAYTIEGKPVADRHGPTRATAWSMIAAALLSAPAMPFFLRPELLAQVSVTTLGCIVYLGVLTSVVAYLIWYYALANTRDPSKVAIFSNLQPVATALAAWVILGEPLTWEIAVGGVLVLVGVRVTQRA